jgi:cytosine/adenosine deaminase-related metal-dependent hydrolase
MVAKLVRGRSVICGVGDDGKVVEVAGGAVLIEHGLIAAVGHAADLERETAAAETLGGDDFVIFPGLVNAHHHVGVTPFQLGSPDLPLELWLIDRMGARIVPRGLDTLYSGFEMVRSGVTTVQHLHNRVPGGPAEVCAGADEVIGAYRALGMRVSYSYCLRDQNRIVYGDDDAFLATLPDDLAGELRTAVEALTLSIDGAVEVFEHLFRAYAGEDRVAVQLAPLNYQWCSDAALERMADVSRSHGAPMHMHLLETPYQRAYARRRVGGSPVAHLRTLGLLNERMTLGHGVWTTEADLDAIAAADTRICHNCSSNMRLKSGAAPLNAMLARGIKVAIGIDEAGMNDDRDMLLELRQVLRAHRPPGHDCAAPTAAQVFRMATEHGAATTGFGGRIGRIEAGRAADMVLLRWSQVAAPYLDPEVPALDAILARARSHGVDTVLVGGEAILKKPRSGSLRAVSPDRAARMTRGAAAWRGASCRMSSGTTRAGSTASRSSLTSGTIRASEPVAYGADR